MEESRMESLKPEAERKIKSKTEKFKNENYQKIISSFPGGNASTLGQIIYHRYRSRYCNEKYNPTF